MLAGAPYMVYKIQSEGIMVVLWSFLAIVIFSIVSMAYVYKYRGQERFESFGEYVRKGWPIFTPFNCLLYAFTKKRARQAIPRIEDFQELAPLIQNWQTIREEVLALYQQQQFDKTKNPDSAGYYDIGFRTFYKYGWSKFYLTWYGQTLHSAQKFCPRTVALLEKIPTVNGAMFSLLPVGSQLTRHLDPVACSLRFHLGLSTPNAQSCYINVDGKSYSWRDGEGFLFDETYLHFAKNDSDQPRLILMCDVERPMHIIGKVINFFYKGLMRLTIVPNLEGDQRGLANRVFATLSPLLKKSKQLKQTNKKAYLVLKHSVNFTLLLIVAGALYGLLNLIRLLATQFA